MIAVSACLAGEPCRYDGRANRSEAVSRLVAAGNAVCICPECLGGLSTPREPAEIVGGSAEEVFSGHARVLTKSGADVTAAFVRGAYAALTVCRAHNITEAVLKAKSPSCGCGAVYDGTFSGRLVLGDGLTAAVFRKNGISVQTEQG